MSFISALINVALTIVWIHIGLIDCHSIDDVRNLKQELFKNRAYDATIRPLVNQSQVLKVNVSLSLNVLYDIDLNTGYMRLSGYLTLFWIDEQLRWNSSQYGGLSKISVSNGEIWKPGVSQMYDLSLELPFLMTWVMSNGMVFMLAAGDYISRCDLDMRVYPIDKHICDMTFMPSSTDGSEVEFVSMHDTIDTDTFNPNGKWDLLNSEVYAHGFVEKETGIPYTVIYGKIAIQRRPYFILLHTLIPLSFLISMHMFVFTVPLLGGERITFSVTLFLTLIFFTIDVSDDLPQTSTYVSWISINLILGMVVSGYGVVASIVLCKLAEESEESIQPWLRRLTVWIIRFRRRKQRGVDDSMGMRNNRIISALNQKSDKIGPDNNNATESSSAPLKDGNAGYGLQDEDITLTWKRVADNLDYAALRICLILAFVLSFAGLSVILMNI